MTDFNKTLRSFNASIFYKKVNLTAQNLLKF